MTWNDDFNARVNFAASYISGGKPTTRRFDSCFENNDGDAVVVALYRRTRARPDTALARNLWRYIARSSVIPAVWRHRRIRTQNLPNLAAQMREQSRRTFAAQMAYGKDLTARPTYHDGTPRKRWHELGEVERESWIKNPTPRFPSELTPEGEQTVIPGCERNLSPKATQLDLF